MLIYVLRVGPQLSLTRSPWFVLLVACSMLERLSAFASDIALERDWTTQVPTYHDGGHLHLTSRLPGPSGAVSDEEEH